MTEYKTKKGGKTFSIGYKRCKECNYYILFDGSMCPCCNGVLKKKPKNSICRRKFNERFNQIQ